jgi:hypothetical protein
VEGTYDIAFMMDTPRFLNCFSTQVEPNPAYKTTSAKMAVEYLVANRRIPVGGSANVKFRLHNPRTGLPASDIPDMTVLYYRSDGRGRTVVPAQAKGDGVYEVRIKVDRLATYYVFVGSRSEDLKYNDLPFLSLMGTPAPKADEEKTLPVKAGGGA